MITQTHSNIAWSQTLDAVVRDGNGHPVYRVYATVSPTRAVSTVWIMRWAAGPDGKERFWDHDSLQAEIGSFDDFQRVVEEYVNP